MDAATDPTAAELSEAHNSTANSLFAGGFYGDAVEAYTRAIDHVDGPRVGTFYSNRAQARLKLDEHELAAYDAAFALSVDPTLWKARLRLMRALAALGRADEAAVTAQALLDSSPPAAAAQEASALLRRTPAAAADPTERLVLSTTMTLRVHAGGPALQGLRAGSWQALTVRVCNEMGLFDQRWAVARAVRLRLLPLGGGAAPPLRLCLRTPGAADVEGREVVLPLERGRAVAEVRLRAGDGQAVLWASAEAPDAAGLPPPLGYVSPPLAVSEALQGLLRAAASPAAAEGAGAGAGAAEAARGEAVAIGGGEGERGGERDGAGAAVARLLPALRGGEAELAHCFRLVAAGGGGGGGGGGHLLLAEAAASICGRVWDSALALVAWLRGEAAALRGARVLELGSGCGVGGLGAAALGARVVLTDLPEALPLLRLNARLNAPLCAPPAAVAPLAWGADAAEARRALGALPPPPAAAAAASAEGGGEGEGGVEWVVSSDVVYEPAAYAPLLATLRALGGGGGTARPRVVMAHRSRNPEEHRFFRAAAEHFDMRVVHGPALRPLGAAADAPPIPTRGEEGISGADADADADDPATVRILEFEPRVDATLV